MDIIALPFSALRLLLLLQILTAQTANTMAATKNKMPPTIPAAIAFSLSLPFVAIPVMKEKAICEIERTGLSGSS